MLTLLRESAHWLGIVPLAFVFGTSRRKAVDAAYYWLAVALGISWIADSAAHRLNPWAVTFVYVISQAALTIAVFLPRRAAIRVLVALCLVGLIAPFARDAQAPDYLLHTIAWGLAACVVWEQGRGRLRAALTSYYGLGVLSYLVYAAAPSLGTWSVYQGSRLLGIALFCLAVADPKPVKLTLHRPRAA